MKYLPTHWRPTRLKHIAKLKGRLGWQGLTADEYREAGPYVVSSAHFDAHRIRWKTCPRVSEERYSLDENIQLRIHDVLLMKDGAALGKLAFVDDLPGKACLNSHLLLIRPAACQFVPRFFFYLATTAIFLDYMRIHGTGATFHGVSQTDIGNFSLLLPPLAEQRTIAAFLDHETAKIDRLIAKQERLIELLKEKRQAVISHAVTKGLNPDAPMKDSGVEWLGEVPEHWEKCRLDWFFQRLKRLGFEDEEVLSVFREYGVIRKIDGENNHNKTPEDLSKYQLVESGDLVVNKMKCWQGSLGISNHRGITSPDYLVLRASHHECDGYLHHLLRSNKYVSIYLNISNGIRPSQWRVEPELFSQLPIYRPPVDEQRQIAAFIHAELGRCDGLVERANEMVDLLRERRSALISAAVTGKIDLREWKPPNSDRAG